MEGGREGGKAKRHKVIVRVYQCHIYSANLRRGVFHRVQNVTCGILDM